MTWIPTATLFLMMLGLGMTLRGADFRRLTMAPRAVTLGLFGQLVVLPAVAFGIAGALGLSPALAVGLVLIAACPGGVTSNLFTWLARGEVALSLSLTAASSLVSFLTVPFLVSIALRIWGSTEASVELSLGETLSTIFASTALPVLLGMGVNRWRTDLAKRLHRPLIGGSSAVLVLLIIGLGFSTWGSERDIASLAVRSAPAVALLIASTSSLGFFGARALGLGPATARTLALEIGVQNFNLSLVVALALLGDVRYAGAALIYLPVMLGFGAVVVVLGRRSTGAPDRNAPVPNAP
jgi:BASS family bile acid:Na+ symporter